MRRSSRWASSRCRNRSASGICRDLGGMPHAAGMADRLARVSRRRRRRRAPTCSGAASTTARRCSASTRTRSCTSWSTAIIGDNYPVPDRMLVHAEKVVRSVSRRRDVRRAAARGNVRPLRGRGRHRGDVLRVRQPDREPACSRAATPSRSGRRSSRPTSRCRGSRTSRSRPSQIEQSEMADGRHTWQYPDAEIAKLEDPRIKAFFLVNPQQPGLGRDAPGEHRPHRRAGTHQAPGSDPAHRRRLRHVRRRLPLAGGRAAAQHHPGLLVLEALRLHRLAPGRGLAARGQRDRPGDRATARGRSAGACGARYQTLTLDAGRDQVHRPHRRRQPRRRAQSHRRALAAAAGADDAVLAVRAARRR